jgi:hypothetical protein
VLYRPQAHKIYGAALPASYDEQNKFRLPLNNATWSKKPENLSASPCDNVINEMELVHDTIAGLFEPMCYMCCLFFSVV